VHYYHFVVYSLDVESLDIEPSATPAFLVFNLGGRTLARAALSATYQR
jgi:phosphatidylethanolamine-binding protein (PEBP) family uncharacterized protein